MPRDKKPSIGSHRSNPPSGWKRVNPTGEQQSSPMGSHRAPSSGWKRVNPTGEQQSSPMGSHRAPSSGWKRVNPTGEQQSSPMGSHRAPSAVTAPQATSLESEDNESEQDSSAAYTTDIGPLRSVGTDGYADTSNLGPSPVSYAPDSLPVGPDGYADTSNLGPGELESEESQESESGGDTSDGLLYTSDLPQLRVDEDGYTDTSNLTASSYSGGYASELETDENESEDESQRPALGPRAEGSELKRKPRFAKYEGEESGLTWRAASPEVFADRSGISKDDPSFQQKYEEYKKSDRIKTDYHTTPEQREQSRLKETGSGKVEATHQRDDDSTDGFGSEQMGWVMDPSTANIHTFDPSRMKERPGGKKVTTHHTTPLGGGDVAGAGMMKVVDGHIHKVTDESGHYRPEADYTHQSVEQMAERGLLDREADEDEQEEYGGKGNLSAKVALSGYDPSDPRQGKQWLKDEKDMYKGELKLPYKAFLQTQGNERQARVKKNVQDDLMAKMRDRKAPKHRPSTTQDRGEGGTAPMRRLATKKAGPVPDPMVAPDLAEDVPADDPYRAFEDVFPEGIERESEEAPEVAPSTVDASNEDDDLDDWDEEDELEDNDTDDLSYTPDQDPRRRHVTY